ncbi:MAG: hypothetical protein HC799_11645 [Limnothrix sp. RL_2_0]|nr:hypothetical protein [Limnothrix sp. RL_2_0]
MMFNSSFPPTLSQPVSSTEATLIIDLAIVLKPIKPYSQGLIRYKGRCWNARCTSLVTLTENTQVQVIGDYGDYLLVYPFAG